MPTFYDGFGRSNGGLGNGWTALNATPSIVGGYVNSNVLGACYNNSLSDTGKQYAICHCAWVDVGSLGSGPFVKCDGVTAVGYAAYLRFSVSHYYLIIGRCNGSIWSELSVTDLGTAQPYYWSVSIEYDNGVITASYNGATSATVNDLLYVGNAYAGMKLGGTSARIDDFSMTMGAVSGFDINEDVVGNFGSEVTLHATGIATTWTAGTPGAPSFTVDHGTISAQEVLTATTATVTYRPGDFLGTATFTDPSTGATDTVLVTSDPNIVPPTGNACGFTPQAVTMVNNTAGESWVETLLKPSTPIHVTAGAELELETAIGRIGLTTSAEVDPDSIPDAGVLWQLYRLLNGGYPAPIGPFPEPSFTTTDAGLATLRNLLNNLTSNDTVSLLAVVAAIKGSPGGTIQDVLDNLGGSVSVDLQPILDKLALIQPGDGPSLDDIASLIQDLSTIAGYTLGDVLTAIERVRTGPTPSLATILNYLNAMRGNETVTLASIEQWCVENAMDLTNLQTFLNTHLLPTETNTNTIITMLEGLVNAIAAAFGAIPYRPYWPGQANVNLGGTYSLTETHHLAGAMDGVIIEINGADPGTGFYDYDTTRCFRNVGALSFYTDNGAHESFQALGWPKAIYCPQNFRRATGVRLHTGHGPYGWITPWCIKPAVPGA